MQGATPFFLAITINISRFQSTLPMQGATISAFTLSEAIPDFNPRSLCRERHNDLKFVDTTIRISIHAPYAGSDD